MSPLEDNLSGITRVALERLQKDIVLSKYVNRTYNGSLLAKPSKWQTRRRRIAWYLDNLKLAWLDAIKALAGKNPHEHCDEDY